MAVNYTQSWRNDHEGSDIKPSGSLSDTGYACDFGASSSQWFRFSGAAGTHMLDSCPKWKSCGTLTPFWTDERMPKAIGVETMVEVYGVREDNCRYYTKNIKVIRCTWDTSYDFIYKKTDDALTNCNQAFCSMS